MVFSKAEEEPLSDMPDEDRATEVSETAYMGEGPAEARKDKTEVSETAYMGEPEERHESKHETEYHKRGPRRGKGTLETHEGHHHGEDRSPEPGTPDFWPSTELDQDEDWEPPTRNKPDSAPWEED